MAILLDHLIVPSRDPVASARSLATLLGTPWEEAAGPLYAGLRERDSDPRLRRA